MTSREGVKNQLISVSSYVCKHIIGGIWDGFEQFCHYKQQLHTTLELSILPFMNFISQLDAAQLDHKPV
jgi:hypothetical protein